MNKDGLVRIIDPDLNTNENIVENLRINVWSDSDPRGISTNIIETDKDTGIFEGKVTFTTNGESNGHILYYCCYLIWSFHAEWDLEYLPCLLWW